MPRVIHFFCFSLANLRSDGVNDQLLLELGLVVVDLPTTQGGKHVLTLLDAVFGDEVTGGVGKEPHADDDDETEEDLESNGETPHQVLVTEVGTVVNPVGNRSTDGNDTTLDTDEQTTVASLGALGLVGRDSGSVHAVTDTGDDTTNEELQKRNVTGIRGDLNDDTDNHDNGTGEDHPFTSSLVTEEEREHSAHQTTYATRRVRMGVPQL